MYPTLFRSAPPTTPLRERLETPDGDFIDIDWHHSRSGHSAKLAVVSHGLEGNSRKKYMAGMARELTVNGWDVICLNFRGCSGEMNRLPRLYHSGVTDDLHTVICHGLNQARYSDCALVGFSMGGNQTLKYLGENPGIVPPEVRGAVVFSVPCRLGEAGRVMEKPVNRIYMEYFMAGLRKKIAHKALMFPEIYDTEGLDSMKTFFPFDDKYTGPVHGFSGAEDYYEKCSSYQFLACIDRPTLIVQAKDDPFLPESCYPFEPARYNSSLFLEIPRFGGHVGFVNGFDSGVYWMEERAASFLSEIV